MKLYYKNIKNKLKSKSRYQVTWTSTRRVRMAEPGQAGGAGGAGSSAEATTRIDVIDPHIVQMLRDVMSREDSAQRLRSGAGSGGGGGGGGGGSVDATNGGDGPAPGETNGAQSAERCICSSDGAAGDTGENGQAGTSGWWMNMGGAGGGGAGGNGGALVIITTTPEGTAGGTITVTGGTGGMTGIDWQNQGSGQPGGVAKGPAASGNAGKKIYIQV